MKGSSSNPRTGDFGRPLCSASQAAKFDPVTGCWRRWGFVKLEGLKEETSANMQRGSDNHRECELFHKLKIFPKSGLIETDDFLVHAVRVKYTRKIYVA